MDEHHERMERAYASRTLGELAGLTTDLLADPDAQPVRLEPGTILATFRKESRSGRWVVPERIRAVAFCGDCHIDLREALLRSRITRIDAFASGGAVTITVPEGVRVRVTGHAILGSKSARVPEPSDPNAPVLEVHCVVSMGSVTVKSPGRKRWFGWRR